MALIQKEWLASDAVDGSKLKLSNNQALRSRNAADSADVDLLKLDGSDVLQFLQLPQVPSDPSAGNDVVRKSFLDTQLGNYQTQK
jgi:hypothetical protein